MQVCAFSRAQVAPAAAAHREERSTAICTLFDANPVCVLVDDFVWAAPEVTPPSRARHSWASDLWSLGVILFATSTCSDKWQTFCASLDPTLLRRQTTGLSVLSESSMKPESWSPSNVNSLLRALKLRRETLEALTQTLNGTQVCRSIAIDSQTTPDVCGVQYSTDPSRCPIGVQRRTHRCHSASARFRQLRTRVDSVRIHIMTIESSRVDRFSIDSTRMFRFRRSEAMVLLIAVSVCDSQMAIGSRVCRRVSRDERQRPPEAPRAPTHVARRKCAQTPRPA